MKSIFRIAMLAIAAIAVSVTSAKADFIDVNLAGWTTFGGYDIPGGVNSGSSINIGAGSTVTSVEFNGVVFTTLNGSWGSELVLSVNDDNGLGAFWDWAPDTTDSSGTFGPFTSFFGGVGAAGPFGEGGGFTSATGLLWITAYESFNDGGNTVQDAEISAGTLRVNFTRAIPEPSLAIVGLVGFALAASRRRRS